MPNRKIMSSAEIIEDLERFGIRDYRRIDPILPSANGSESSVNIQELTPSRSKRKNDDDLSNETKRSNTSEDDLNFQPSYKKMTELVVVCIIHCDHPQDFLTKERAREIQGFINGLIDSEPEEGLEIRIQYCKTLDGGLEIGCMGIDTANWIKQKITELQRLSGIKLKWTDTMVAPFIVGTVRVDFDEGQQSGLGVTEEIESSLRFQRILVRLMKQNKGLNIKEWVIIDNRPTDRGRKGVILRIQIPLADGAALQKSEGFLYYQCRTLKVNYGGPRDQKRVKLS